MTSSAQDGAGDQGDQAESPAPPAFSPLTDPVQHTREPSVNLNLDDSHHQHAAEENPPPSSSDTFPPVPTTAFTSHLPNPLLTNVNLAAATMNYLQQQSIYNVPPLMSFLAETTSSMPPHTIRPEQVSIRASNGNAANPQTAADPATINDTANDTALESFARIEFQDSTFHMTTYAVMIGRDQAALVNARKKERKMIMWRRQCEEANNLGLPQPEPPNEDRKYSKSYVSTEGGMLGPESVSDDDDDGEGDERATKRRKLNHNHGSGSGESQKAPDPEQSVPEADELIGDRRYVSHTPGAAAVNLGALRCDPFEVPFVAIHSPAPNTATGTKGISRKHLKIQFMPDLGVFFAIPQHRNGFFCQEVFYKDQSVMLRSFDRLQIKDVEFTFIISGVPRGQTGAETESSNRRYSEGGKEMSFDFESNHGQERLRSNTPIDQEDSVSEVSELPEEPADEEMELPDESNVMETIEKEAEDDRKPAKPDIDLATLAALAPMPPKKRGPGRPPKNGIMSKREERLRKKALMEEAKKNLPPPPPGDPPIKRKVGRPRKHPLPEDGPDRPEKRKYKPRKKNGEDSDSEPERATKAKRRDKHKTPPLVLQREEYTDDQLQKPNKNYGVLIDEVLSAAPDGLSLRQIYKRIQMRYPYFYFLVDTKGWESSVRHNLIGNGAFKKDNETQLWSRVLGIDIDAGKKRKANSPDNTSGLQNIGQAYQHPNAQATTFRSDQAAQPRYAPGTTQRSTAYPASQSPSVHQYNTAQPGTPGQQQQQQQQTRQVYTIPGQVPTPAQTAGYQAATPAAQTAAHGSAYASSYSARATSSTAAPTGPVAHQMVRQYSQTTSNSLTPDSGTTRPSAPPAQSAGQVPGAGPSPRAPAMVSLKPAIAPELVSHIIKFKDTVVGQLSKRSNAFEAVSLSAVRRKLGLTSKCMVAPSDEALEKIVFGVLENSLKPLGPNSALHPNLLERLLVFKDRMIGTMKETVGDLKAELLVLSAFDQAMGFSQQSTMQGSDAEKAEFHKAEAVIIPVIKKMVTDHQTDLAAATAAVVVTAAPSPTPVATPDTRPAPAAVSTTTPRPAVQSLAPPMFSPTVPAMQKPSPTPLAPTPAPGTSLPGTATTAPVPSVLGVRQPLTPGSITTSNNMPGPPPSMSAVVPLTTPAAIAPTPTSVATTTPTAVSTLTTISTPSTDSCAVKTSNPVTAPLPVPVLTPAPPPVFSPGNRATTGQSLQISPVSEPIQKHGTMATTLNSTAPATGAQ